MRRFLSLTLTLALLLTSFGVFSIPAVAVAAVEENFVLGFDTAEEFYSSGMMPLNSVKDGIASYTLSKTSGTDSPYLSKSGLNINLGSYSKVVFRLKNRTSVSKLQFYYFVNGKPIDKTINIDTEMTQFKDFAIDILGTTGIATQIMVAFPGTTPISGELKMDSITFVTEIPNEVGWFFETPGDFEGWTNYMQIGNPKVENGAFSFDTLGQVPGRAPTAYSPENFKCSAESYPVVKLRIKNNSTSNTVKFYFRTSFANSWSEDSTMSFNITKDDTTFKEYTFDLSTHANWKGTFNQFMVSFGNTTGKIAIDSLTFNKVGTIASPEIGYDFNTDGNLEGWTFNGRIDTSAGKAPNTSGGAINYYCMGKSGDSPAIFSPSDRLAFDMSKYKIIKIRMKNETNGTNMRFYFKTTTNGYSEAAASNLTISANDTEYKDYIFNIADLNANWTGIFSQFMIALGDVTGWTHIDSFKLCTVEGTPIEKPDYVWSFNKDGDFEKWDASMRLENRTVANGVYSFNTLSTIPGSAPAIYTPADVSFPTNEFPILKFRIKNETSSNGWKFYFKTSNSPSFSEANTVIVPISANDTEFKDYEFDMSQKSGWTGNFSQYMIALGGATGKVSIDSFSICKKVIHIPTAPTYYDFDDNTSQGFVANDGTTLSAQNMAVKLVSAANTVCGMKLATNFSAADYTHIVVGVKNTGNADNLTMNFGVNSSAIVAGNSVSLNAVKNYNNFVEYAFDLKSNANWKDTITELNLNGTGEMEIDYITLLDGYTAPTPTLSVEISSDKNVIDTLGGSLTLTGTVLSNVALKDYSVEWEINSPRASIVTNADGTATITARTNGEVIVTAKSKAGNAVATKTIIISNQPELEINYDLKVMLFGNSILNHGAAPSLGWYGNWGMAASEQSKDYAHRLMNYYVSNKYGKIDFEMVGFAAFERTIKNEDNVDYTADIADLKNQVAAYKPNLINIQMGENVSAGPTASRYANAVTQLVEAFQQASPGVKINLCTPFWGGNEKIKGMEMVAKAKGLTLSYLDVLNTPENMAGGLFENTGVALHPCDLGMDNIAKLIWANFDKTINDNFQPNYIYYPTSITLTSGIDTITTDAGTLQMGVSVLPTNAATDVIWSVDNVDFATIDQTGLLTAKNNGTVKVIATSNFNKTFGEKLITISNQSTPFTVTYNANTTDIVTELPQANTFAKGTFKLSTQKPIRSAYQFKGWTLAGSDTVITELAITQNVEVFAKWVKATAWEFEEAGYLEGVTVQNGFNVFVLNGKLMSIATNTSGTNILSFTSPKLSIDTTQYKSLVLGMQNTVKKADTVITLTVNTSNGVKTYTKPVSSTEFTQYVFDLSDCTGTIEGYSFTPTNTDCTVNIDYMKFVSGNSITYDANTTDTTVSGIPEKDYPQTSTENYVLSIVKPYRKGFKFVGWGVTANSTAPITSIVANENKTVYAIWQILTGWEFENGQEGWTSGSIGNFEAKNGTISGYAEKRSDNTYDAILIAPEVLFSTDKYQTLKIRMSYNLPLGEDVSILQLFFKTEKYTQLSEENSVRKVLQGNSSNGFIDIIIPMVNSSTWLGSNVTFLRLDPISGPGSFVIESIEFLPSTVASFNSNGGSGEMASITAEEGKELTLPNCTFKKFASTFVNWTDGTKTYNVGDKYILTSDVVFTAVWKIDKAVPVFGFHNEFNTDGNFEDIGYSQISSKEVKNGILKITNLETQHDARLFITNKNFDSEYSKAVIRYRANATSQTGIIRFQRTTDNDQGNGVVAAANAGRAVYYPLESTGEWVELVVDMTQNSQWNGTISHVYIDPYQVKGGTVEIDYIRFIRRGDSVVNYNKNTAEPVANMPNSFASVHTGTGFILSSSIPTRAGYTFLGWSESATGSVITNNTVDIVTADKTVYAVWLKNQEQVTIKFSQTIGATGTVSDMTVKSNTTITLPHNVYEKPGYTFSGWTDGKATYAGGATYNVLGFDVEFFALWTIATPIITPDNGSSNVVLKDLYIDVTYSEALNKSEVTPEKFGSDKIRTIVYNDLTNSARLYINPNAFTYGTVANFNFSQITTLANKYVLTPTMVYTLKIESVPDYKGENMISNGDFEMPWTSSMDENSLSNDVPLNGGTQSLRVPVHSKWSQAKFRVKIDANKKYYLSFDGRILTNENGLDASTQIMSALYVGTSDQPMGVIIDGSTSDGWKHAEGLLGSATKYIDSDYFFLYTNPSGNVGVNFALDNISLKEAFPVSFTATEVGAVGTVETQYWPKDKQFKLPECTITLADYTFTGWSDGAKTYKSGDSYIGVLGGTNFIAVFTKNQTELGKLGDVNQNGSVDAFDVLLILQYLAKTEGITLNSTQLILADIDSDNSVTPFDASLLLQFLAKVLVSYPIGQPVIK